MIGTPHRVLFPVLSAPPAQTTELSLAFQELSSISGAGQSHLADIFVIFQTLLYTQPLPGEPVKPADSEASLQRP